MRGYIVRTSLGIKGIVIFETRGSSLDKSWVMVQEDRRCREYTSDDDTWLEMLAMDGGAVRAPAALCDFVRVAEGEDLEVCYAAANKSGQRKLESLYIID